MNKPPARYSEDIDLVQVRTEPAGSVMEALREVLNPWLGNPRYRQSEGRVTFKYRFESEEMPPVPLRLKVEINTRVALKHENANAEKIIECFVEYMNHGGHHVTRKQFEDNLDAKLEDQNFVADIGPLLASEYKWDIENAADAVRQNLIGRLDK